MRLIRPRFRAPYCTAKPDRWWNSRPPSQQAAPHRNGPHKPPTDPHRASSKGQLARQHLHCLATAQAPEWSHTASRPAATTRAGARVCGPHTLCRSPGGRGGRGGRGALEQQQNRLSTHKELRLRPYLVPRCPWWAQAGWSPART